MEHAPDRPWASMIEVSEQSYSAQRAWNGKVDLLSPMKMVDANRMSPWTLILLGRW